MDTLPTELQEHIMIQLSPRDLAHLRTSSATFRQIVQSNLQFVCKTLTTAFIADLQGTVDRLFNYDKDQVDMLESLRRLVKHRGLRWLHHFTPEHDRGRTKETADTIAYLWSIKYIPQTIDPNTLAQLRMLAGAMFSLNVEFALLNKRLPNTAPQQFEEFIELYVGPTLRACGYERNQVAQWFDHVALGPPSLELRPWLDEYSGLPKYYLTIARGWSSVVPLCVLMRHWDSSLAYRYYQEVTILHGV